MGTFVGHIIPSLVLTLLGLWHTFNTIKAYILKGPTGFSSRFWYPLKPSPFNINHLELILIITFSILAIVMQILDFPLFQFSAFKLNDFEHATMFLHLAIYAGVALAVELTDLQDNLSGLVSILAASVFGQELFLLHFHSADHIGLEGHYHWLLQLIVFVSLAAAIVASVSPSNFAAALVLSITVVFQGCWFMIMGFILWVPQFIPRGCVLRLGGDDMHGAVACEAKEASLRATALANLQFSWILAGILISTATLSLIMAGRCTVRNKTIHYEKLHSKGSDVAQISMEIDCSKLVHP
ncbi:transmembrane protein 45B [Macadamia integrifolia]|uniref:transmembrane protein 45B n=1 Tax=Macadamia integrifolia TaxID=60698 RepID=UPI001C4F1C5D|nr:transmembrane protein 45B [Macadamia integrifolia]